jgi:ABC-type multidrug transport system permease subunit
MNFKSKKDKTSSFAGVFFIVSTLLIVAATVVLETLLLRGCIVSIQRGTFWGTTTVIIGSIIVFAICIVLGWALYAIYFKWNSKRRNQTENLSEKTEKFWSIVHAPSVSVGIITVILLQLFTNDYFITIPHGTHKGGMIAGIGSVIIVASVLLLVCGSLILWKYFKKRKK